MLRYAYPNAFKLKDAEGGGIYPGSAGIHKATTLLQRLPREIIIKNVLSPENIFSYITYSHAAVNVLNG